MTNKVKELAEGAKTAFIPQARDPNFTSFLHPSFALSLLFRPRSCLTQVCEACIPSSDLLPPLLLCLFSADLLRASLQSQDTTSPNPSTWSTTSACAWGRSHAFPPMRSSTTSPGGERVHASAVVP